MIGAWITVHRGHVVVTVYPTPHSSLFQVQYSEDYPSDAICKER